MTEVGSRRPHGYEVLHVLVQGYAFLAVGIAFVATSRILGPERFGTFATIYSSGILLATLLHFSLGQAALAHAGKPFHATWIRMSIRIAKILSLVAVPIACVVGYLLHETGVTRLGSAWMVLGVLVPLMMWDYYGMQFLSNAGQIVRLSWLLVIGKTTIGIAMVVGAFVGPVGSLAGLALGLLIEFLLALRFVDGPADLSSGAITTLGPLRTGLVLHVAAIGSILLSQGPVVLLAKMVGQSDAGQYLLAFQILAAMLVLPTGVSMALAARIAKEGPEAAWRRQVTWAFLVSLALIVAGLAIWLARPVLLAVLGQENAVAVRLFGYLLPTLLGWPMAMMIGSQWIARNLMWQSSVATLTLALCNLGMAWLLIKARGSVGAPLAMSATFSVVLVLVLGFIASIEHGRRRTFQ